MMMVMMILVVWVMPLMMRAAVIQILVAAVVMALRRGADHGADEVAGGDVADDIDGNDDAGAGVGLL